MADNQEKSEGNYEESPTPAQQRTGKGTTTSKQDQAAIDQKKSEKKSERSAAPAQQEELDLITKFAEQLAQALTNQNRRTFTQQTIAAVERYGEIAAALIVPGEAESASPGSAQSGSGATANSQSTTEQQSQTTQASS